MKHLRFDLGHVVGGTAISVTLDRQANVHLVDAANYDRYRRGTSYRAYGGRQVRSPAALTVPHTGHWYIAIDLGGAAGTVRASVTTTAM